MKVDRQYSPHKLIGCPKENFYQLGQMHNDLIQQFKNQLFGMLMNSKISSQVLKIAQLGLPNLLSRELVSILDNFAHGCGMSKTDVYAMVLLPEVVNAHSKWSFNMLASIPGCSTILEWDKHNKEVIHSRIVDYPLTGAYSENESTFILAIPNRLKLFYHASLVMPFPLLSVTNEAGITMSLHQKFSAIFNRNGESILSIVLDIMLTATNLNQVKKMMLKKCSISSWGLVFSDSTGRALHLDINGNTITKEEIDLIDQTYYIATNIPLAINDEVLKANPANYIKCSEQRHRQLKKSLLKNQNQTDIVKKHFHSIFDISPLEQSSYWQQSALNCASIAVISFKPFSQHFYYVDGPSPKIPSQVIHLSNYFKKSKTDTIDMQITPFDPIEINLRQSLAKAQSYFDQGSIELAFHHLQMALVYAQKKSPERHDQYYVIEFFIIYFTCIHLNEKNALRYYYTLLLDLNQKLPRHLNEHCYILMQRLEKKLELPRIEMVDQFRNEYLKQRYIKERKLRNILMTPLLKLTYPRIEIPDVLYLG